MGWQRVVCTHVRLPESPVDDERSELDYPKIAPNHNTTSLMGRDFYMANSEFWRISGDITPELRRFAGQHFKRPSDTGIREFGGVYQTNNDLIKTTANDDWQICVAV